MCICIYSSHLQEIIYLNNLLTGNTLLSHTPYVKNEVSKSMWKKFSCKLKIKKITLN